MIRSTSAYGRAVAAIVLLLCTCLFSGFASTSCLRAKERVGGIDATCHILHGEVVDLDVGSDVLCLRALGGDTFFSEGQILYIDYGCLDGMGEDRLVVGVGDRIEVEYFGLPNGTIDATALRLVDEADGR